MTPRPSRPGRARAGRPLLAAAALVAGAVGAGGTVALWNADDGTPLGLVTAGNLDVELLGEPNWRETSPDVADAGPIDDGFLARPGDTVTMSQQLTTELRGDNMLGALTVDWDEAPQLAAGTTATYSVRDASGRTVLHDVPLGDTATIEGLDTDDAGRTDVLTLEVAIEFTSAMDDRVGPDAAAQVTDLGTIVVDLDQVRTGEGFSS